MHDYSTSKTERIMLREEWEEWIRDFSDWKYFITLTFGTEGIVTRDQAENSFRFLVQVLNQDLYRNHYMRIVGHSYFSYVVGFEHQKRGTLHMHVLVDQPIKFSLVHSIWQKIAGWAWIVPVTDLNKAVSYISKYVAKEGDLVVWKQRNFKLPSFVPMWFSGK
jgi:hypothetical protein